MKTGVDGQPLRHPRKLCRGRTITAVVLVGILFFLYMGLQHDVEQSATIFSYVSSNRSYQYLQWPKRTQTKPCYKGSSENNPVTITTNSAESKQRSVNTSETERTVIETNVHNLTQRTTLVDSYNKSSAPSAVPNLANESNSTVVSTDNTTLSNVTRSDSLQETAGTTVATGCDTPCPPIPPGLEGSVTVNKTEINMKELEDSTHFDVGPGGHFAPRVCKPRHKVAIIIPYRDREAHLAVFLNHMHPFLMKQQIEYQIFVVEQKGHGKFNRATLMNIGFVEAGKLHDWDCFIFHDVDLLPLNDRNLYTCPEQPRHLSAAIDKFDFKLPYGTIFGGVSALTTEQFKKVNGFSNSFWGWGGEDDDMANRINFHGYHISRYPMSIARYTMLNHDKEKPNQERYNLLTKGKKLFNIDGLNSLQYTLVETQFRKLFTHFLVELHAPS